MMITDAKRPTYIDNVPLTDSLMLTAALVDRAELRVLQAVDDLRAETRRTQRRAAMLGGLAALCLGGLVYLAAGLIL